MKTFVKLFLLTLSLLGFTEVIGQSVVVCIEINGTPMPGSKTWSICRKNSVTLPANSSVTLEATNCAATPEANVTISWKNISVPPSTDSLDNIILAQDTGKWVVTIMNNVTSIPVRDTLHLVYYSPMTVVLNDGSYVTGTHGCPLTAYNLTTTGSGPISSYQWFTYSPKAVVPGVTGSSHIIQKRNTYYIVEARDANNCKVADTSIYFNGLPTVNINIGADPSVFCEGNSFNIVSSVPTGYPGNPTGIQWGVNGTTLGSTTTGITNPPAPISVMPPAGSNKFWLKIDQFPICSNVDTVVVTTDPIPVVSIAVSPIDASPTDVCYGANTDLTANVSLGTGPYNYTWTSAPASTLPSSGTITVSPTANTTYTVSVTDANNCGAGTNNISLNVNPEIIITTSGNVTICRFPTDSTTITGSATGGVGGITYQWSPTTGINPGGYTSTSTKAFPTTTTTYTMTATDANNCSDVESIIVTSYEPQITPITSPQIINEDAGTTLTAVPTTSISGVAYEWTTTIDNAVFSTSNSISLEYLGPDTIWYVIKTIDPTPVNGNGLLCYNTDTVEVRSISNNILMYVPNVFSPNAMEPTNQTIKIYSTNILPDGFKWLIFNKWGNLMYETTDVVQAQSVGWDGGSMVEGVYSYVIIGKFKNNKDLKESEEYKGTFTLIK
jgi:hypothetical protein